MHLHSLALFVFCASFASSADAHWWWKTKTVTCTVTSTKTVHTCTSRCSTFGVPPCTSSHSSSTSHARTTCSSKRSSSSPTSQHRTTTTTVRRSSSTPSSKASSTKRTTTSSTSRTTSSSSKRTTTSSSKRTTTSSSTRTSSSTTTQTSRSSSSRSSSTVRSTSVTSLRSTSTSSKASSSSRSSVSTTSLTLSPSLLPSQTTSNTALPSTSANTGPKFLIRANSPTQPEANGQYAVVSADGFLQFGAADPANAAQFTLSSAGQLLYNLKRATIDPSLPAAAIQFNDAPKRLKAKRQAGTAAVTCIVTADANGAALLECAADASTIQQACGVGFYLGASLQCQPLTLTSYDPGSAAATVNTPQPRNPTPGQPFSIQANGPPIDLSYSGGYAAYFTSGGITELAFANYFHGAVFSLDSDGHLVGVAPCPPAATDCTGNAAYAATFKIGDTNGPIAMMYGEIAAGYTPIVCRIPPGFDAGDGPVYSLSCQDGANGANAVIQQCQSDIFYLGTAVGAGCSASTLLVKYTS